MAMLSNEIVQFCAGNDHTSNFITAFQDYYCNYRAVNEGMKNFSYDSSLSLDEKSKKIHDAFFSEVEARSGVERNALNVNSWMANPNVRWVM